MVGWHRRVLLIERIIMEHKPTPKQEKPKQEAEKPQDKPQPKSQEKQRLVEYDQPDRKFRD